MTITSRKLLYGGNTWMVYSYEPMGKKLEQFLNGNCPIIKFTANYSREEISSLGVAR